jgi:hypothetical protein
MEITKNLKKEVPYISLAACPICGEHPEKVKESLEGPNGRGYRGCFTYEYKCECCKLLRGGEASDIYVSSEEANNLAKELWNDKVASTKHYLDKLYVSKAFVESLVKTM